MNKVFMMLIIALLAISLSLGAINFEEIETTGPFYVIGESSTITVFFSLDGNLSNNQRIAVGDEVVGSNPISWVSANHTNDLNNIYGYWYLLTIHVDYNDSNNYRDAPSLLIQLQERKNEDGFWYWHPINNYSTQSLGSITQYMPEEINPLSSEINLSANNNTIEIHAGTYPGKIVVTDKHNITIKGDSKNNTVIKGYIGAPVISLVNCTNIRFENVTIKNGFAQSGGAVNLTNSSIILINSDIRDNGTIPQLYDGDLINGEQEKGCGIYANLSSSIYTENCSFYNNEPLFNSAIIGQTLYLVSSDAHIMNCNMLQELQRLDVVDFYAEDSTYYFTNSVIKNPNILASVYNYCCIYGPIDLQSLNGVNNISTTDPKFVDLENYDFNLLKGSPLIGSGFDMLYCDYSVSEWNQDLLTINDPTKEIGACSYDLDRYATYSFTDDPGYNWVSFPVIDNDPISNAIMANFFAEYNDDHSLLLRLKAQVDNGYGFSENYYLPTTLSDDIIIDSKKGYKLRFSETNDMNRFHGYHIEKDAYVEIPYEYEETWIGYFITPTQEPRHAFRSYMDELYFIQHKDWTMVREQPKRGSPWIMPMGIGGVAPSISYGDMVIVKRFHSNDPEDKHFQWWQLKPVEARPYNTAKTNYFQFEEEADYTPIFVEIDSTLGIKEVAIYADDECKGAAVVENNMVMIHGYLSNVPVGAELDLRIWDDTRKIEKVDFNLFNQISADFEPANCVIKNNTDYYRIRVGSNNNLPDNNINSINSLTINNYPNPFNPETTISFNNPQAGKVNLSIYNLKGQLVRKLLDDEVTAGAHSVVWNGKDARGKSVASGIYFTKIKTEAGIKTKKMLMMK